MVLKKAEIADQYSNAIKELEYTIAAIRNGVIWRNDFRLAPHNITYDIIYPNGKNGDIDMFIAGEYGTVQQISSLVHEVRISTEYYEQIALMHNSYLSNLSPRNRAGISLRRDEINSFLGNNNLPLSIAKLNRIAIDAGMCITNSLRKEAENIRVAYMGELRNQRRELYSELAATGLTTAKWKSEQQAYAIVKSIYADAIYQYHSDWLEFQSIDIFVPSLSIGIEYQGAQHYRAISCFGGEKGLNERLKLDNKKRIKCAINGVTLIEWRYDEPLDSKTIQDKIANATS